MIKERSRGIADSHTVRQFDSSTSSLSRARSRDRLTDNQGRTVSFRNAILIMTSNIGASLIAETSRSTTAENEETIYQEMSSGVLDLLGKSLRPEFLNRIDERIVFRSLSLENIKDIVDLPFKEIAQRLVEQEIHASLTGQAGR